MFLFTIAWNGPRTTIILRFDGCMADTSVSPIPRSTPRSCYRQKPSNQMRRNRERMDQHRNSSAEKIVHGNNISRQYKKDEDVNRIRKEGSALHSIRLSIFETAFPARREKAQDDIQQVKRPASSIFSVTDIKEDKQDRDEVQLFGFDLHKETTKTEETTVKTTKAPSFKTVKLIKVIKTRPLFVSTVTAHPTHLSKETRRVKTQRARRKSPDSKLDLSQANQ